MATPSQSSRLLALTTPLGTDKLLLEALSGEEGLSTLFRFELDALASKETTIGFDAILGKSVTVAIMQPDGSQQYRNGIVSRFGQLDQAASAMGGVTMTRYRLEVVPSLWLLTRKQNSQIFQQISVPDILKKIFTGLTVTWQIQGTFKPRDYCAQYRETDFAFASRLMEEEGIWYYFKHANGSHTLVVGNTPQSHDPVPGTATIRYATNQGGTEIDDSIRRWRRSQEIASGKVTLWDYCFEMPDKNFAQTDALSASISAGTVSHPLGVGNNSTLEIYDYPGRYAQRFDGVAPGGADQASELQNIFSDNARTGGIRADQLAAASIVFEAEGDARQIVAGHKFTLSEHFNANGDYIVTKAKIRASQEGVYFSGGAEPKFELTFSCVPLALPYRPLETTPRPIIAGPQTAVVVGPSGEEIFTDKYGRVKVQFPWDRLGKKDQTAGCWVRVGSIWAGKVWGGIHIPRIGQEVIVSFEDGDPDKPIIVGSVYNATNMPPYTLPDNKTQSGVKSRSSQKGDDTMFNELRFEDKKDSEEIYFHAEKDFNRVVENNDTLKVGFEKKDKGDRTVQVFNNHSETIGAGAKDAADGSQTLSVWNKQTLTVGAGEANCADGSQTINIYKDRTTTLTTGNDTLMVKKGNRSVTISEGDDSYTVTKGKRTVTVQGDDSTTVKQGNRVLLVNTGDDTHTVKTGNRTVEVSTGNDQHTVKMGNRTVEVSMGNDSLTIKMGNQTTKLNLGASSTEAMQGIELKVGANSIKIDQMGITIKGMMVAIEGQVQTNVKGTIVQVQGSAMLKAGGGITMIG